MHNKDIRSKIAKAAVNVIAKMVVLKQHEKVKVLLRNVFFRDLVVDYLQYCLIDKNFHGSSSLEIVLRFDYIAKLVAECITSNGRFRELLVCNLKHQIKIFGSKNKKALVIIDNACIMKSLIDSGCAQDLFISFIVESCLGRKIARIARSILQYDAIRAMFSEEYGNTVLFQGKTRMSVIREIIRVRSDFSCRSIRTDLLDTVLSGVEDNSSGEVTDVSYDVACFFLSYPEIVLSSQVISDGAVSALEYMPEVIYPEQSWDVCGFSFMKERLAVTMSHRVFVKTKILMHPTLKKWKAVFVVLELCRKRLCSVGKRVLVLDTSLMICQHGLLSESYKPPVAAIVTTFGCSKKCIEDAVTKAIVKKMS